MKTFSLIAMLQMSAISSCPIQTGVRIWVLLMIVWKRNVQHSGTRAPRELELTKWASFKCYVPTISAVDGGFEMVTLL